MLSLVFKIAIICVVYVIIIFALRIMYKDIRSGDKKKEKVESFGLQITNAGKNTNLKQGEVIAIHNGITIGRKDDNIVILNDEYASSHHVRIYLNNKAYYLEDLDSTNGTRLNSNKVVGKLQLKQGDMIRIGTAEFKIIG